MAGEVLSGWGGTQWLGRYLVAGEVLSKLPTVLNDI